MRCRGALLLVLLSACGGGMAGPSTPTPSNGFRPEDRVVIGDFSRVNAIAATSDRVYVVYPSAVALWRPLEQRWDVPRSPPRPGQLRGVTSAITDPLDRSLWLAAGSAWIHYDPFSNRWDEGELSAPAEVVALDGATPGSGVYFRTVSGWLMVPRVGGVALPSAAPRAPRYAPSVNDAMRDLPQLRALAPHIATGPLMIQGALTAAAPDPQGNGWFLGTATRGLVYFDRLGTDAKPIPLGLPGDIVGAIATTPDGIWVGTDYDGVHLAGVTMLASDLSTATSITGPSTRGLPFGAVRRFLSTARALWLATDKGVARVAPDDDRVARFDASNGLPDERVTSIVEYRGQVVAGTLRGLGVSRGDSGFRPFASTSTDPVYSLLVSNDTLWVGTARGLFASIPGNGDLRMPEGFRLIAAAPVAVLGVGYVADTLVAMTRDRLLWRDPVSGGWSEGPDLSGQLGPLLVFAPTANGIWVGGSRGAAFVRPTVVPLRVLSVPSQLPDEVTAIATDGHYLWIGTRSGLVRFLLIDR